MVLALMVCASSACDRCSRGDEATIRSTEAEAQSARRARGPLGFRYPTARWRLATWDQLDLATVWVGHIAIRHEQSSPTPYRLGDWRPDTPPPSRSVTNAFELAEKIEAQLVVAPDKFEQLARKFSEDVLSRDDGGMLGGVRVSQLARPGFLDALATLKPGEISKVFRTSYGFHIVKRYPVPSEQLLAGERIVIKYQGVPFDGDAPRSRAQALALAREVAEQAKKDPDDFSTLVERYSESTDREQDGDIGVYSTRDPGYLPVEIFRLEQIAVGEVLGPMDSPHGYEILKRVPVLPRKKYAATTIELPLDFGVGGLEQAKAATLEKAKSLRRILEAAPKRFAEFQSTYCCERVRRWTQGRMLDVPLLTPIVDALALGEVAPEPVFYGNRYLLVKRLDPSTLPPAEPRVYEIPDPSEPDYDALMRTSDPKNLAGAVRAFVEWFQSRSALPADVSTGIVGLLGQLAHDLETNVGANRAAARTKIYATMATLERRLTPEQFEQFKSAGRSWAIEQFIPPASPPRVQGGVPGGGPEAHSP